MSSSHESAIFDYLKRNSQNSHVFQDKRNDEIFCTTSINEGFEEFEMVLGGGADRHMTKDLHRLTNVVLLPVPIKIEMADIQGELIGTHSGDMEIELESRFHNWTKIILRDVLYVPNLSRNLLSAEVIVEDDLYRIDYRRDYADVYETGTQLLICSAMTKQKSKFFRVRPIFQKTQTHFSSINELGESRHKQEAVLWHRRLGHPPAEEMRSLPGRVLGLPANQKIKDDDFVDCDTCVKVEEKTAESCEIKRKQEAILWHRCLGHASAKEMKFLPGRVLGFPAELKIKDEDFDDCEICLKIKGPNR